MSADQPDGNLMSADQPDGNLVSADLWRLQTAAAACQSQVPLNVTVNYPHLASIGI